MREREREREREKERERGKRNGNVFEHGFVDKREERENILYTVKSWTYRL